MSVIPASGQFNASDLRPIFFGASSGEFSLSSLVNWTGIPANFSLSNMSASAFRGVTPSAERKIYNETGLTTAITTTKTPLGTSNTKSVSESKYGFVFNSNAGWGFISIRNNATTQSVMDIAGYARLRTAHSIRLGSILSELRSFGYRIFLDVDIQAAATSRYSSTLVVNGVVQTYRIDIVVDGVVTSLFWISSNHARTTRSFEITNYITSTSRTVEANVWINVFDNASTSPFFSSGYVAIYGIVIRFATV